MRPQVCAVLAAALGDGLSERRRVLERESAIAQLFAHLATLALNARASVMALVHQHEIPARELLGHETLLALLALRLVRDDLARVNDADRPAALLKERQILADRTRLES